VPATTAWPATKVALDVGKERWHPSVLPGQVVLVTTVDEDGRLNLAPKSSVTMAAFGGPVAAFGCTTRQLACRNAQETGERD
jgi:flavin reductase (DIM6/NTAB) family NADH-FMN oxidoreductase RutF